LIAALMLTIVVPIMYDAIYGAETNAYMVTDPAWVGVLYFCRCVPCVSRSRLPPVSRQRRIAFVF
jgi:hypothetical protein